MDKPLPIDPRQFREAMARFSTGITVVTSPPVRLEPDGTVRLAPDGTGGPHGVTVNAFASLSLTPPLVLICIEHGRYSHAVLEAARVFAVNVLAAGQEHLSRFFSTDDRPEGPGAFDGIPHRPGRLGAPILEGCLAAAECRITGRFPGGDHTIFVGTVETVEVFPGRRPLVYYNRAYRGLTDV
jgi:flavin reductase (DIM6/NTAB) family NADH-FMN oxidoreductase RutF